MAQMLHALVQYVQSPLDQLPTVLLQRMFPARRYQILHATFVAAVVLRRIRAQKIRPQAHYFD